MPEVISSFRETDYSKKQIIHKVKDIKNDKYLVENLNEGSAIQTYFSLPKILIIITFLNLILIFGGTIWNATTVTSIQENYDKSLEKIRDSEGKYKEAALIMENSYNKLNMALSERETKYDSIVSARSEGFYKKISSDSRDFESRLNRLNTGYDTSLFQLRKLNKEVELFLNFEKWKLKKMSLKDIIFNLDGKSLFFLFLICTASVALHWWHIHRINKRKI
jgi:hypothetical protein